jgi:hypothetical protein
MQTFEIVFQGQVKPGFSVEQARTRLGQLFQAGDQQLDVLFSGRRVVIKQGLDASAAAKYREAIERAGALCLVEPMGRSSPAETAPPAAGPDRSASEAARPSLSAQAESAPRDSLEVKPRDAYMAAFADVQAPNLGIAPLGADLQDDYQDFVPLPIDLSALSLAPVGADLEQLREDKPARIPETDHLRLQD